MNPTVIVEVTENCNLACTFCLRPSFTPPVMSLETLEAVIAHVLEVTKHRVDFIWHGGEPLLAGPSFFSTIPRLQSKYNSRGVHVVNNVQTNGTLLRPEMASLLEREGFAISTSIQGTHVMHDSTRVTVHGKPTYARIITNIARLQRKPPAIVVLTTEVIRHEAEVYYETKPHVAGIRVSEYFPGALIPSRRCGSGSRQRDPLMPTSEEYGQCMIRFYEIWKDDPEPIDLRPVTEIIQSFVQGYSNSCLYSQKVCNHSILAVKSTGEFYTCIRGAPDQRFQLGHVRERPFLSYQHTAETALASRVKAIIDGPCGTCEYWPVCNGGCPLESYVMRGNLDHRTYYCEGRKMLFARIAADLGLERPSAPETAIIHDSWIHTTHDHAQLQ